MNSPRCLTGLGAVTRPPRHAVVTVGVFDGVHRAHQRLIRQTVTLAHRLRGTSVAITFDPDPQAVLDPAHAPPALMPLHARVAALHALGIDWVWVLPFTRTFARCSAQQFVARVLLGRLRAKALVVGERFVFGRRRQGDLEMLRALGPPRGMRIVSVGEVTSGPEAISSSRIRRLIAEGQLAASRRLLGRPPELYGEVVRGAGRGRRLGFPTANLRLCSHVLPPRGVYAVVVRVLGRPRAGRVSTPSTMQGGVMNLGVRPTFGGGPLWCEVHLLQFAGSLLGRSVVVSLLQRLRGERCFPTPADLTRQVRRDIARARRLLRLT